MTERVPDWLLERAALGELPADRADELRARIDRDADATARLADLARSDAEILAELAPAQVAAEVARRARAVVVAPARRSRRTTWMGAAAVVACAALLAIVLLPRDGAGPPRDDDATDVTRVKGVPRLVVHRKRGETIDRLERGSASAAPGDRIQLSYLSAGAAHGAVLSIDGSGVVTLHFPDSPAGSTQLAASKRPAPLRHSYELDEAPGYERFFFVTSARDIDVERILEIARQLARNQEGARTELLALPPELGQWSFLVRKDATR